MFLARWFRKNFSLSRLHPAHRQLARGRLVGFLHDQPVCLLFLFLECGSMARRANEDTESRALGGDLQESFVCRGSLQNPSSKESPWNWTSFSSSLRKLHS